VSGIQGVVNILSAPSTIPQPFDAIYKGVQIAALTAATAANIAKISSQSFESTSANTGGTSTTTPAFGGGSTGGSGAVPGFNLFGQGNNQNTVSAETGNPLTQNQQLQVQAVVSETEITATQLRVSRYRNSAEL
jgi:hypothetical protein